MKLFDSFKNQQPLSSFKISGEYRHEILVLLKEKGVFVE